MTRRKILVIILLTALSALAGYLVTSYMIKKDGSGDDNMGINNPKDIGEQLNMEDTIRLQIDKMTTEEKIGQMFILGVEGDAINNSIVKMINDYHVGGFIFMGKSIKNPTQLLRLVNDIKSANSESKVPLFLSIDQEGGSVDRLHGFSRAYPSNMELGKINSENLCYDIGSTIAYQISSFGFNMDFAPVLDINSNPKNQVIGDRSFGTSPQLVGSLGIQTMKGIQNGGVISVVKHFPGHGDTSVDSHVGLPRINRDLKGLEAFELIPFAEAVKNNADGIMIAHILLPKIDPDYPASMSNIIINDILRDKMGFNGVVITDDMTMGAISKNYTIDDAAPRSINAGCDIILIAHDYNVGAKAISSVIAAVNNGTISMERIDESVYRILQLKRKYNLEDRVIDSVNNEEINSRIGDVLENYLK